MKKVRDGSRDAYYSEIYDDTEKKQRILDFVRLKKAGTTRRQIATALNLDTATVSGLVTPMIQPGGELIESEMRAPCPITRRSVHWLHHPDNRAGQLALI